MSRKPSTEEKGHKAPAYLVTFSALVTLLMLFFVMLLTLSSAQDEGLFGRGLKSFSQSIRGLGLGMFSGQKQMPDFGHIKPKYPISEPDEFIKFRTIDAREEKIRRSFIKARRTATTMPSQIVAKKTVFSLADIRFSPGRSNLNRSAKNFLTRFALNLQQDTEAAITGLYVLGLADERTSDKERWILSAVRAQAAADFLRDLLPAESFGAINWWGAGPGGDWVGQDSAISKRSQILIAILKAKD